MINMRNVDIGAPALLREVLQVLECHADRNIFPVTQAIAKLRNALGDSAEAYGADDPLYPSALQFAYSCQSFSMEKMLTELKCGYKRVVLMTDAMIEAGVIKRLKVRPWYEVVKPADLKVANA